MKSNRFTPRSIAVMGMLAALSIALVWLVRVPMFLPFLEYEPADVPVLIGTLMFGPAAGLALTVVVSFIQGFTVSAGANIVGVFMHIVATGAMVLVVGLISRKSRSVGRTAVALVCGALTMTLVMIPLNLIVTPLFMNAAFEEVAALLVPAIIPFNLVKAGINCAVTFVVFCAVRGAMERLRQSA